MHSARCSKRYAALTFLGLVLTWYFNFQHFAGGGTAGEFLSLGFVNSVSSSLTVDLLVACVAFVIWMVSEGERLGMKARWLYPCLAFGVAFAFAGPLFLWMRERQLATGAD